MFGITHENQPIGAEPWPAGGPQRMSVAHEYSLAVIAVVGITLPALLLQPVLGYRAIALVYLMAVAVIALFVGRGPTLLAAALSALFWDYFFLAPITHLSIANPEDVSLFAMYIVVASVLGQLTARIRAREQAQRQGEARAKALYTLTRGLVEAPCLDELVRTAVEETGQVFDAETAVLLPDASGHLNYHAHPASRYEISGPDQVVADWVFEEAQPGGQFTSHEPQADALFMPLTTGGRIMGVMAVCFRNQAAPVGQHQELFKAFLQQIALALDCQRLREKAEAAKLLAESERLSKNLLNSMSHEIRTPLAAIKSAAGSLAELQDPMLSESRQQMVAEIQEAADRLNRLVGKVLDITRLESGRVKVKLTPCDLGDLVHVAIKETREELIGHEVTVRVPPGLPLVRADYVLLLQALVNLLSNAAIHTPPGTAVEVTARVRGGYLELIVADRGPGIAPECLPHLFEKFYRAPTAPTGGTGLGLSIVKGLVEAQGGRVKAENRPAGGAVFEIRLPIDSSPVTVVKSSV